MLKATRKMFCTAKAVITLVIGVLAIAFDFWVAKN